MSKQTSPFETYETDHDEWADETNSYYPANTSVGSSIKSPGYSAAVGKSIHDNKYINAIKGSILDSLSSSPLNASALGLMSGVTTASIVGHIMHLINSKSMPKSDLSKLLLGGAGVGLASGLGLHYFGKSGYFQATDPVNSIAEKLKLDPNLNAGEEERLLGMIETLDSNKKSDLERLLSGASGAAIGMIVARYLLKLGLVGQLLFTLAGGALGGYNNNLATGGKDMYGRPYSL